MNKKYMILSILTSIIVLGFSLSGCERLKQAITPETTPTIKIGIIQPSGYYTSFAKGAQLAQTEINNSGGILGMEIEVLVRDNQGIRAVPNAEESVKIAKTLIQQENVLAILGPIFSNNSIQVAPVVQQLGRPMISGSAGNDVTSAGDFIFLVVPPTSVQAGATAEFAYDMSELGAKTAATIFHSDSEYTETLVQAFEDHFQKLGGKIVASETYQIGDKKFDTQLTNIQDASPDVLYIAGVLPDVLFVTAQAREMDIEATFLGTGSWDEPQKLFTTLDNNEPLEGSYFASNFSPELQHTEEFVNAYESMFNEKPDSTAASGYDAMSILANAIEKVQTLNPTVIKDEIANTTNYQGASTISHFDENRHPIKSLLLHTIRDGQIVLYKVIEP